VEKHFVEPNVATSSLVELLRWRAEQTPQKQAYTFLTDGEVEGPCLTYAELDCQARAIGALLQQHRSLGERALLLYPPGLEFIAAFYGCLYAGVMAIPAPPPDAARLKRTLPRLQAIALDAQASLVLTTSRIQGLVEDTQQVAEFPAMRWLATEQTNSVLAAQWQEPAVSSDSIAYLQYTSGSTSTPKGVMVSHRNLMFHSACISKSCGYTPNSVSATWMPYFHDYGLVEGLTLPLYNGTPCFVMSPLAFIKRPIRWLQTISRYKVTHSQGPNFAYDQCLNRIKPEQHSTLDLSSWCAAGNAAEPINYQTIQRFTAAFQPYGFHPNAFSPAYGLAEATLLVSASQKTDVPVFLSVFAAALEKNQIVEASKLQPGVRTIVGCGRLVGEMNVVIVEPETLTTCLPDRVGEIWVSDKSVAQGYWNRPDETKHTFCAYLADTGAGPFLRTGDLGFIKDGELFVTGRIKDLIVIRGTNHYPQDIEWTVEQSHPALRSGYGAAFSVDVDSSEQLVVVQEVERHYPNLDVEQVAMAIRQAIAENHELEVYAILLLKTGSILKTSSGKIQRHGCRAGFLDGSLEVVGTWTSNKVTESKQQVLIPDTDTNGAKVALTEPRQEQTHSSVAVTDVAAATLSRKRADDIISWLRSYANERINSRLIDERRCIPPYVVLDFGNRGILGMQVAKQYGGTALGNRDAMRVVEQLAAIDLTLATFVVNNDFLGIRPIQRYATKELQDELLPILAKGRELAAFALTEPGAGSNPQAISATGVADAIGGWRLRGTKVWSGSASWAGVINIFAKVVDPNTQSSGITGFAVRQGTAGLRQGPESLTMGMRGMVQNFIYLDDVPVGAVNLLGRPGAGMDAAKDAMLFTRLAIGAMSVGGMKRCTQLMLRYATGRSIATGRLLDNPVTLVRLGELTAATTAFETLVTRIAELLDNGDFVPAEAYIACKTSGPELLWKAADSLVQLLGGRGYIETNIASQILRDARVFRIFEGPTETLNMFLGSRVLHQSSELQQFLCHQLKAQTVWDSLTDAVQRIQARWSQSNAASLDRPSSQRYAHLLIGEVTTSAIVLATVEFANRTPSNELRRAVAWARSHFDATLAKALSGTPVESVLLSANETTAVIGSYAEAIGELEQTLAGEDRTLDQLLRHSNQAEQIAVASPNQISDGLIKPLEESPPLPPIPKEDLNPPLPKSPPAPQSNHTAEYIEAWLAKWLAEELGITVDAIDPRNSFVKYGIDSVTAVRLADDLEVWLGRDLPLTVAWDYPSIEALAQHLAEQNDAAASVPGSVLVKIKPDGAKPPFFGVHGASGGVFFYYNLARYLSSEQPVYGLEAHGLDGKQASYTRVEDMATHYIREILTLQPEGPYFLGGYSFGGLVAFEMAQQLRAQGKKVALLALFDARGPQYLKPLPFHVRTFRHLNKLLQLEPKQRLTYVQERLQNLVRKFSSANGHSLPQPRHQYNLLNVHQQVELEYVPTQVYSEQAILFRADEQLPLEWWFDPRDPLLGWAEPIAGGLEVQGIPGNHENIFNEPYVRVLAEKLQACLEQAQLN